MKVLVPRTITDAMLTASSIAEPAATETAWNAAEAGVVGIERIRTSTHRVYKCTVAHAATAVPPEENPTQWTNMRPTLKWAAFDGVQSTQSTGETSISWNLTLGFFNAVALYLCTGATATVTQKDGPGGAVIETRTATLLEPPSGWYNWLFGRFRPRRKVVFEGFTPYPGAELVVELSAAAGADVGVGIIAVGDMMSLLGEAPASAGWGPEHGATAEPKTASYIKILDDGTAKIKRRHSGTDLRVKLVLPASEADQALALVQEVLDIPACWITTTEDGFAGLNTFGLGQGQLVYEGPTHSIFNIVVKGLT